MTKDLFSKNFILLFLSNFLICVSFYILMAVLPPYAMHDLGIDASRVGLVVGIFSLSAVLMRPILGSILDKHGRMPVYIIALILFAICSGAYVISATVMTLIILRILHGISWSGVNTASSTIVADIIPANLRGEGIGYFGLSMTVGMAIGPALGVLLIGTVSYDFIFYMCMVICLSALIFSAFIKIPKIQYEKKKLKLKELFEKRVYDISLLEFFFGFVYSAVIYFSTLVGIERNINGIGAFFIVFAIFIGAFRPFAGKFMDKNGPKLLCLAGFISFALGVLTLGFANGTFVFLVAAGLAGFGAGLTMPTLMTMMINVVPANRRGAANATFFTALDIGIGTGAIFLGVLSDKVGYGNMFVASAILLLVPIFLFYFRVLPRYNLLKSEIDNA